MWQHNSTLASKLFIVLLLFFCKGLLLSFALSLFYHTHIKTEEIHNIFFMCAEKRWTCMHVFIFDLIKKKLSKVCKTAYLWLLCVQTNAIFIFFNPFSLLLLLFSLCKCQQIVSVIQCLYVCLNKSIFAVGAAYFSFIIIIHVALSSTPFLQLTKKIIIFIAMNVYIHIFRNGRLRQLYNIYAKIFFSAFAFWPFSSSSLHFVYLNIVLNFIFLHDSTTHSLQLTHSHFSHNSVYFNLSFYDLKLVQFMLKHNDLTMRVNRTRLLVKKKVLCKKYKILKEKMKLNEECGTGRKEENFYRMGKEKNIDRH